MKILNEVMFSSPVNLQKSKCLMMSFLHFEEDLNFSCVLPSPSGLAAICLSETLSSHPKCPSFAVAGVFFLFYL